MVNIDTVIMTPRKTILLTFLYNIKYLSTSLIGSITLVHNNLDNENRIYTKKTNKWINNES